MEKVGTKLVGCARADVGASLWTLANGALQDALPKRVAEDVNLCRKRFNWTSLA